MYLMIDNYDSFVYNLKAYIDELNEEVMVIRNDKLTIKEIAKMKNLRGIIISPGNQKVLKIVEYVLKL